MKLLLLPNQGPAIEEGLEELTVIELKEIAKDIGIDGYSSMKKAELIKSIEESET